MNLILHGVGDIDLRASNRLRSRPNGAALTAKISSWCATIRRWTSGFGNGDCRTFLGEDRFFMNKGSAIPATVKNIVPDTCNYCVKRVVSKCAAHPDKRNLPGKA